MSKTIPENIQELKTNGLKATTPRIKVLQLFQQSEQRHLSAEDLFKLLLSNGSEIGLATVYRVLLQLEQAGLLERHHFEGGRSVFELNEGRHHDHLVCIKCGRVEEFYDEEIEHRQKTIAEGRGFQLQAHELALYGVCARPECKAR